MDGTDKIKEIHKYRCACCGGRFDCESFADRCPACGGKVLIHEAGERKRSRAGCRKTSCAGCSGCGSR
ncbi:MAG TPA: hypothetical protein DCE03_01940 [Synergistaceae bacterium]|jgi:rRNA maturation endonuclease Nob1|nr:hypothetical protein [Synergistaceae bacterium]HAG23116.1 hypothetical protein [Synergistaceae bacterium]